MPISTARPRDGVVVVTVDYPPVNALPSAAWFELARTILAAGDDPATRAVVLTAAGRGFNAGVDIKEMQATAGFNALVDANLGCAAAFSAVYDCAVPVIAAVHGFCVGGGIGLVGNADVIVASDDAVFGLPEVDRGALGAATHLARLVPPHLMRALYYTAQNITAGELQRFGSVYRVVPREDVLDAALDVADRIAAKDTRVIRAAKQAINTIDPVDVKKSYLLEQRYTYELNLAGVADEHRDAFVAGSGSEREH
ncbi:MULTISPECIES: enoyl-CoA hydratase family protein [unclassified Gordonia (in: high G+C Gram-positive bacteria)]|uniref:enoyl-CoA hydratase family protein n=1 Tax=unclassified Gordonia (in: high G+C Gram-positive bacteria) TaxID=2657482 RepID=UPI001FFF896E|nr:MULTISPECIES: enoyl-CoA hydratase family protein [unclassified Gordonia (in: high G+C Gram-positive bacteria)]UQE75577.1 enoyl-CoA hydratase family protein [Gordonia sp. PP30]